MPSAATGTTQTRRGGRPPSSSARLHWWLLGGVVLLLLLSVVSLLVGVAELDLQVLAISRLPRLVAVLLAGAALSVGGLIMQRITQNRFVSPSTSGTTESAVLGILIATLFFGGSSLTARMVIAIVTALIGTFLFLRLLEHIRHNDPVVVALVGLMYGGVITAITVFVAFRRDLLQFLDIWTTGSFSQILQGRYEPLFAVLLVGAVGYLYADRFTVVGMGADFAANLGVAYKTTLYLGLVVVSVMAAVVVVVVGVLPFLGLIVPNIVSLLLGDNVRAVLPVTAVSGAGFVLLCDIGGRVLRYPYEMPASTVVGIIGAVIFIALILRSARGVDP